MSAMSAGLRAVTAACQPRARTASASSRPKPVEQPVISHAGLAIPDAPQCPSFRSLSCPSTNLGRAHAENSRRDDFYGDFPARVRAGGLASAPDDVKATKYRSMQIDGLSVA